MGRWLFIRGALRVFSVMGVIACQTPPEPSPIQDMTIIPQRLSVESPAVEKLERLNRLIEGHPQWEESAAPLIIGLEAQKNFDERQWDLAQQGWLQLLKSEEGQLGDWAFRQWLATYQQILKANASPEVLAQLLLAETDGGQASPFLKAQNLIEKDLVVSRIAETIGQATEIGLSISKIATSVPSAPGRPADDPLLEKTSQSYCLSSEPQAWRPWIRTLNNLERSYWQAMVAICRGDQQTLANILPGLAEKLQKAGEPGLAVASAHRLVDLYRATGDREAAAKAYLLLVEGLNRPDLTAQHLNMNDFDFQHFHANQVLWASRQRALIGDYLSSRDLVQRSFRIIDNAYRSDLTAAQRRQLEELRAEGFHILAFRISYEQQDFESALIQTRLGSRIEFLNDEWRFRFAWYEGWYQYRAGRLKEAYEHWEKVLKQFSRSPDKEKLLFWLSVTASQRGERRAAHNWFEKLCQEFPLGFYALVAPRLSNMETMICRNSEQLIEQAKAIGPTKLTHELDPVELRRNSSLAPYLYRAELAIRADLGELIRMTVDDLYRGLRKQKRVSQDFRSYLYMSRLLYAAQDFHRAIALAYELSLIDPQVWADYPDQVHVFFPMPYREIFERNSSRFFVETSLLLAVTRRESTFRPEVKSPAGALGLMQLMPRTAEIYAARLGQSSPKLIVNTLNDPEINIRLGSAYLAELSRIYKADIPSMLAAYNAGEYAVDRWLAKRTGKLPLEWIEAVPFGETQGYVKGVMRNWEIYRQLTR